MPFANEAAILNIGISSIIIGIMSPLTSTPCKSDDSTKMSATSSLHIVAVFFIEILPPIDFKTCKSPDLVGFIPTFLTKILESLAIKPATIIKAADEKSPTTSYELLLESSEGL